MKNRKIKVLLGVLIVLVLCVGIIIKNKTNTLSNGSINKESITKELDNNLIGAYIQEGEELLMSIPKCTKKGIYLCTKRGMKLYT